MYHTTAWVLWLAAALLPFTLTRNPYYVGVALAAVWFDYHILSRYSPMAKQWRALFGIALMLIVFSVAYNVLFVSVGATKLATLPALRLNLGGSILQIGGAITLESLVFGLLSAASLFGLLLAFATFNLLADHYQLLRRAPRFLYQSAIVLSIAITFVPQLVTAQAEIREAQLLRGHRMRGVRDLLPLFITLLAEGLEHSITLAESMSARGLGGGTASGRSGVGTRVVIALGLFAVLCGTVALTYLPDKMVGAASLALGGVLLAGALWRIGARVHISRYRRIAWERQDIVVAVSALGVMAVLGIAWLLDPGRFVFYPYPRLELPEFDPLPTLALLLLAVPGLLPLLKTMSQHD